MGSLEIVVLVKGLVEIPIRADSILISRPITMATKHHLQLRKGEAMGNLGGLYLVVMALDLMLNSTFPSVSTKAIATDLKFMIVHRMDFAVDMDKGHSRALGTGKQLLMKILCLMTTKHILCHLELVNKMITCIL